VLDSLSHSKKEPDAMKYALLSIAAIAGLSTTTLADPPMLPVGANLRFEVALPGGAWSDFVQVAPGQRVEWRAVLNYTGSVPAAALGRIFFQPTFSNVDNYGSRVDSVGFWRNGGISGQANSTLAAGLLGVTEGNLSASLGSGYGRVRYGFTSRSTAPGNSGALTIHRHSGGSAGAPAGDYLRIAGANATSWMNPLYPGYDHQQILWGVVSDNSYASSTWFTAGTTNIVLFRQAFIPAAELSVFSRTVTLSADAYGLQRAGGSVSSDDTRFMTWAAPGEGGSTATIRVGVSFTPARIRIPASLIPSPGSAALFGIGTLLVGRRRRVSR
jgi:hypothetical protein